MPRVTPEIAQAMAKQFYDYELDREAASSVARIAGAMAGYSRNLERLKLEGRQPPFGYPALIAEAERVRGGR